MKRWLAGHVLWPVTERLLGRDTIRRFRELLHTQHLDAGRLRELQNHKLRTMLRSADAHCPYYARRFRAAGLDVRDPQITVDALAGLPPITREEIRAYLPELTWRECPGGVWPYSTGGSTGEPLRFHLDSFRAASDAAARLRCRSWWGVWPGDAEVLLWGSPAELRANDRIRRFRDACLNQYILSAFDMTDETMDGYVRFIRERRPTCLYGYASSLGLLARHALRRGLSAGGLNTGRLRAVFTTGEVLLDADRRAIEEAVGVPAVVEYGSRDGGMTAFACPAGRLHVQDENLFIEVLDPAGRPVAPGEVGEIVLTHLEGYGTPLIRYRIGDLARLADEKHCPCGRELTTWSEVRGRVTDQIVCRTDTGLRRLHALALIYVLRELEGVSRFRIVQHSLDRVEVEVVPERGFTSETEEAIRQRLGERLGTGPTIQVVRRPELPPSTSGKHACVVSHVKTDATEPLVLV